MARSFRRAANKVKNSRDGHGSLGLLIFDEKVVYETFQKVIMTKANASMTMLKWAKSEDNLALQDVFSKAFEVSSMWTAVWKDFSEEYYKYRKGFKEVLQQEKVLDEARKREALYTTKMNRVQKQLEQSKRKSDGGRPRTVSNEIVKVISQAEQEQAELEVKTTKHEIFKARKLRDSLYLMSNGLQKWASKTLLVAEAYKKLAELINDTPTQLTESKLFYGSGQTRNIVNDLARDIEIDLGLSKRLATLSHSATPYLYAVCTPTHAAEQDSTKYDYVDTMLEQKPSKANIKPAKRSRAPQPLPHQHLNVKENYLGLDPKLRRPLSLTDLKLPPNLPPRPLPKDAPCQNVSSDSDSDGEGYTKPFTDPTFFPKKMLWKVLSDGAINEVGTDYADRGSGNSARSAHLYQQLERRTYSEEDTSSENEPAVYLDLISN